MRAWPTAHRLGSRQALNREALPEVVLLGHANCGKSALLNALGAEPPRKSRLAEVRWRSRSSDGLSLPRPPPPPTSPPCAPHQVHSRAGWTAHLSFVRAVRAGYDRGLGAILLVDTRGSGWQEWAAARAQGRKAM
jgi:ribosome biogenesis GTPase A